METSAKDGSKFEKKNTELMSSKLILKIPKQQLI